MWLTGPAAPRHVGSSQTRARTRVPRIGRQTLNHCATREAPTPPSFLINLFIYLFLAALSLHCCTRAFSSCGKQGLLFIAVRGLLIVASLLWSTGSRHLGSVVVAHRPQSAGSVVVAHGFSCSEACRIFPDQSSKLCPLHWQADSQPLRHEGSP